MDNCSKDWCKKMSRCKMAAEGFEPYHKWQPINYTMTNRSKHVMTLMCGVCFQEVNIEEAHKHRDSMD
jgi:hypothetical protein